MRMNDDFQDSIGECKSKSSPSNKGLSWTVIVIIFIFFWPLGIYLVCKKIDLDKKASLNSGRILVIIGWILLVLGVFYIIGSIAEPTITAGQVFSGLLLFVGGGIALIVVGRRNKRNAQKYKKYIDMVVNQNIKDIDTIACVMNLPYEVVKSDLQNMIDKEYFLNAYIDESKGEIIIVHKQRQDYNKEANANFNSNVQMVVVTCKGCGAKNKILQGSVGECEFCGSPISTVEM